ncbi:MAG: hypothetical protein ACXWVK_11695, partial [Rhodoplanes sp.]
LANEFIAPVFFHKSVEHSPRNEFKKMVQNAILMPHGVDPCSCPDDSTIRNLLEPSRINAVRRFKHKTYRTAVGLTRVSIFEKHCQF